MMFAVLVLSFGTGRGVVSVTAVPESMQEWAGEEKQPRQHSQEMGGMLRNQEERCDPDECPEHPRGSRFGCDWHQTPPS
jgi:hypothetical protein